MTRNEYLRREQIRRLAFKIQEEKNVRPEIKRYFLAVSRGVSQGTAGTPSILPILRRHYKRVKKRLLAKNDGRTNNVTFLLLLIDDYIAKKTMTTSIEIDKTTEKLIRQAEDSAREQLRTTNQRAIRRTAARILKNLNRQRINLIAMSETESPTERMKLLIAQDAIKKLPDIIVKQDIHFSEAVHALSGDFVSQKVTEGLKSGVALVSLQATVLAAKKMWLSVGDKKVRAWHIGAHGQIQNVFDPFQVGPHMMMEPGDSSLGATAANIANCRCWSAVV